MPGTSTATSAASASVERPGRPARGSRAAEPHREPEQRHAEHEELASLIIWLQMAPPVPPSLAAAIVVDTAISTPKPSSPRPASSSSCTEAYGRSRNRRARPVADATHRAAGPPAGRARHGRSVTGRSVQGRDRRSERLPARRSR